MCFYDSYIKNWGLWPFELCLHSLTTAGTFQQLQLHFALISLEKVSGQTKIAKSAWPPSQHWHLADSLNLRDLAFHKFPGVASGGCLHLLRESRHEQPVTSVAMYAEEGRASLWESLTCAQWRWSSVERRHPSLGQTMLRLMGWLIAWKPILASSPSNTRLGWCSSVVKYCCCFCYYC